MGLNGIALHIKISLLPKLQPVQCHVSLIAKNIIIVEKLQVQMQDIDKNYFKGLILLHDLVQ